MNNRMSVVWYFVGFFLPIVGVFVFIYGAVKKKTNADTVLISSFLGWLICVLVQM